MLEHLFGSKTRVKLLRLFLGTPSTAFFVREIARKVGAQLHAVRRELENLEELGIIVAVPGASTEDLRVRMRKYYQLDSGFFLVQELRALVLKSQFLLEQEFRRRVQKLGSVRYFALLGMFLGEEAPREEDAVDAFIVGTVHRQRLAQLMRQFEREIGRPVNYAVMSVRDFNYRRDVGDRFLYGILEGKKVVVYDDLTPQAHAKRLDLVH